MPSIWEISVQIAIDYSWTVIFLLVLWSLSAGYFPLRYPGYAWPRYWGVGLVATVLSCSSVITRLIQVKTELEEEPQ